MTALRNRIAALALSAAGLAYIGTNEGFRDKAYVPVPGDKVTIGYGSTTDENNKPIKMGDTVTKERALILLRKDASAAEKAIKKCTPVDMYQYEYDVYVDFTYNVGAAAYCKSTLAKKLNAGDYVGACNELLKWNKFQGKVLPGLDRRRKEENQKCLGK